MWLYLRNLAMGRMLEPVYIMMKKKTPVENVRGSWGLSCRVGNNHAARNTRMHKVCLAC